MTDRLALILALLIAAAMAADVLFNGSTAIVFLLHKFENLVEYAAFWR